MLHESSVYGRSAIGDSVRRGAGDEGAQRRLEPPAEQHERAGQGGDEHHDPVDDGGGDALAGAEAGGAEHHAVAPSRGPQPAMPGTTIPSMASRASGSIL